MKKLAFSALFFSAISWLWIGRLSAVDGSLNNVSGTTVLGGAVTGIALTNNNVNNVVLWTNNQCSLSVNLINGIVTLTNYAAANLGVWFNTNGTVVTGTSGDVRSGEFMDSTAFEWFATGAGAQARTISTRAGQIVYSATSDNNGLILPAASWVGFNSVTAGLGSDAGNAGNNDTRIGRLSAGNIDFRTNGVFRGSATATNGFASFASDSGVALQATGITNSLGKNATAYVTATAVAFTIKDAGGNTLYTSPVLTATISVQLHPSWSVNAASGLAGTMLPE